MNQLFEIACKYQDSGPGEHARLVTAVSIHWGNSACRYGTCFDSDSTKAILQA